MNSKSAGSGRQVKGLLAPGKPLTLSILRLKSVPDPTSGVIPSFVRADIRNVLIVPGPVLRTFEPIVRPVEVTPAGSTGGEAKFTTAESKVTSAWKPV